MENILLSPAIAFFIMLVFFIVSIWTAKFLAPKGADSEGKGEAYAGGENMKTHKVQPDYRQFFPFAFFFTIMHVVALIVATVPNEISPLAYVFLGASLLALLILFRK